LSTLLLIDDSSAHRADVMRALSSAQLFESVIEADDGLLGLKLLLNEDVDVVLCDLEMPGFDGEKVLHIKQASPASRDIPFIFVTATEDAERRARLLELGASDVIVKPFFKPDLLARLRLQLRTKRLHDELRLKTETMARLSTTDAVTGLRTRRYISEVLSIEFLRSRRYESPLSVLMADLDHFKLVNDEYGHLAGDAVLVGVADLLLGQVRATDVAGRYGGEEILVILAQNDIHGALVLAERWRMSVENARFDAPDGRSIGVHISVGIAAFTPDMTSPEQLIARADDVLYQAKAAGRNQVGIAE
jgi:two-component system cell cycle response regulator